MQQKSRLIEKIRLDALTDGVFAVAMTLLVIDLSCRKASIQRPRPNSFTGSRRFRPSSSSTSSASSCSACAGWSLAKLSRLHETVEDATSIGSLVHLLLVTCVPFVTMVVGRYGALAPAIWLYCAIYDFGGAGRATARALAELHIGRRMRSTGASG